MYNTNIAIQFNELVLSYYKQVQLSNLLNYTSI